MSYELKLNCKGFEKYLIARGSRSDGVLYIFRFDNNYGASVVKCTGTYGYESDLWELGVISFDDSGDYKITCDTPIADDVIGWLTDAEVCDYLDIIMKLPKRVLALDSH